MEWRGIRIEGGQIVPAGWLGKPAPLETARVRHQTPSCCDDLEKTQGLETFTPVAPRTLPSLDSWMKAMIRRFLGSVSGFNLTATSCENGFPLSSLPTFLSSSTTATCCSCLPEFSPADTWDAAWSSATATQTVPPCFSGASASIFTLS